MKVYHGSNSVFERFDVKHARVVNDLYGGGIAYFTDASDIAMGYARSMQRKKGGKKVLYTVDLHLHKVFDIDHEFTGKELTKFLTKGKEDEFARGAGLLKVGVDTHDVVARLRSGDLSLTGEQVFKGLSRGGVNSAYAREKIASLGYDGLRYNGGLMGGARHNVYLAYKLESISIEDKTISESLTFCEFIKRDKE